MDKALKISGLSDLEFEVIFRNEAKEEMPVPAYPFRIYYYTNPIRKKAAFRDGSGTLHGCSIVNGRLHVFLDAPRFDAGMLRFRFEMDTNADGFGDTVRTSSREGTLPIQVANPPHGGECLRVVHTITVTDADLSREFLEAEEGVWIVTEDEHRLKIFEDYGIGDSGKKISALEEIFSPLAGFYIPGTKEENGVQVNRKFNLGFLDDVATRDFVERNIAKADARFKGTFNSLADLEAVADADNNDYGFVVSVDADGNTLYKRYKFDGEAWAFEFTLSNIAFSADQWAAIQSGITRALVEKLVALPSSPITSVRTLAGQALTGQGDVPVTLGIKSSKHLGLRINGVLASYQEFKTIGGVPVIGSGDIPAGGVVHLKAYFAYSEEEDAMLYDHGDVTSTEQIMGLLAAGKLPVLDVYLMEEGEPEPTDVYMSLPYGGAFNNGIGAAEEDWAVEFQFAYEFGYAYKVYFVTEDGALEGYFANEIGSSESFVTDIVENFTPFIGTYGSTTSAEIAAALNARKRVWVMKGDALYQYANGINDEYAYFVAPSMDGVTWLRLNTGTNVWAANVQRFQNTASRVTSLSASSTNNEYPAAKCVYDNLYKPGKVSQTITWSGSGASAEYTLSDIVTGNVPVALIEEAAVYGVIFNTTTGYFEYGGYTDIAADEMREAIAMRVAHIMRQAYQAYAGRIILPPLSAEDGAVSAFYNVKYAKYIPASIINEPRTAANNQFAQSKKLEEVDFIIGGSSWPTTPFGACESLKSFKVNALNTSISVLNSPLITVECIKYIVDKRTNTASPVAITLHATAYARMAADTTEYTYGGQTYTGIVAYANAKNITIASA